MPVQRHHPATDQVSRRPFDDDVGAVGGAKYLVPDTCDADAADSVRDRCGDDLATVRCQVSQTNDW